MTKQELLRLMRLLSGMESVMLAKGAMPDYLLDELTELTQIIEREILR